MNHAHKPIVLCILDGWGINTSTNQEYNALSLANTPTLDYLSANFPSTELSTSGMDVGLPTGQMGNSEVGHMTIGSGRIIFQDLVRINLAIENGDLEKDETILKLMEAHKNNKKSVHLLGLCSDGGVHSHIKHLIFIAELLGFNKISVKLHLFLDGRDVSPKSAEKYLNEIDILITKYPSIEIASIAGRFYAMDRDNRTKRTELSFESIAKAKGLEINNWQDFLDNQYNQNISDEFIIPAVMKNYSGINEGDSLLFTNFRSDRMRQLSQKLIDEAPKLSYKIGMTHYSSKLSKDLTCLFKERSIANGLGEIVSTNNKKQLRIAETEKYAHVTFFFNGGREEPYSGEDRILIESPKVNTYDLQPEMSAAKLTTKLIEAIESQKHDLIVVNYANCDMVGHSGIMSAAVKAVEALDSCIEQLYQAITQINGTLIITADHGNIECMFDEINHAPHTSHTLNPVPLLIIKNDLKNKPLKLEHGTLSDIAPTILKMMNIKQPQEMTGRSIDVN